MATISKSNLSREDIRSADKDEKETLLEHDSEPDEDMIFNRPSTSNGISRPDGKMDSIRIQIQEVTDVMRDNVKKVMERGERLEDLQDASDRLSMAGSQFREAAKKSTTKGMVTKREITDYYCQRYIDDRSLYRCFGHLGALPGSQIANIL